MLWRAIATVGALSLTACFTDSNPPGSTVTTIGTATSDDSSTSADTTGSTTDGPTTTSDSGTVTGSTTAPGTSSTTEPSTSSSTTDPTGTETGSGSTEHVFFVTPMDAPGNIGGIAGADGLCMAAAAGLPDDIERGKSFVAYLWIEGMDPRDRLDPQGRILAPDGSELAPDIDALHQLTDVVFLPSGAALSDNAEVWIGGDGTCGDWTIGEALGTFAVPSSGTWHTGLQGSCMTDRHLYCLSP